MFEVVYYSLTGNTREVADAIATELDPVAENVNTKDKLAEEGRAQWCAIEVLPQKDFITYGVGVSVLQMRVPEKARGRTTVAAAPSRLEGWRS